MRLSRFCPRITIRRLMILVTILGLFMGFYVWANRWVAEMRVRSADYDRRGWKFFEMGEEAGSGDVRWDGTWVNVYDDENDLLNEAWSLNLAEKYWRLSVYPWLPVEPDPPRPEPIAHPKSAIDSSLPVAGNERGPILRRWRPPAWTFLWNGTLHRARYDH